MSSSPSTQTEDGKNDRLQIACVGALAFIAASVTHEVIGHGGVALATGGHVALITSIYFRAEHVGPGTDAAGPLANLVLGGLLWATLRLGRPKSPRALFMLGAAMALNCFWGAGVFIYSGLTGTDDWAFLFRGADPTATSLWRGGLVVVGLLCYRLAMSATRKALLPFADREDARPLAQVAGGLYFSASVTCCVAALFFRGPVGPALKDSLWESFGAFVGLLIIARRPLALNEVNGGTGELTVTRSRNWIVGAAAAVAVYLIVLGRGYFG